MYFTNKIDKIIADVENFPKNTEAVHCVVVYINNNQSIIDIYIDVCPQLKSTECFKEQEIYDFSKQLREIVGSLIAKEFKYLLIYDENKNCNYFDIDGKVII
jgi:hypothetical protein